MQVANELSEPEMEHSSPSDFRTGIDIGETKTAYIELNLRQHPAPK